MRKKNNKHHKGIEYDMKDGYNRKKINRRILKERAATRRFRITIVVMLLILTSPIWLYRGIIYEVVLPVLGKQTKAVLAGTMGGSHPWSGSYNIATYYYIFLKNGKLYEKNANICVNDSLYHIGDTVDILYLEALPFISSRIKNNAN